MYIVCGFLKFQLTTTLYYINVSSILYKSVSNKNAHFGIMNALCRYIIHVAMNSNYSLFYSLSHVPFILLNF